MVATVSTKMYYPYNKLFQHVFLEERLTKRIFVNIFSASQGCHAHFLMINGV